MKKIVNLFILFVLVFSLSGCLKRDNMEDISIYTTNYPSEYITQRLYGDYSDIKSIYPDGINIQDYKLYFCFLFVMCFLLSVYKFV